MMCLEGWHCWSEASFDSINVREMIMIGEAKRNRVPSILR